MFNAESLRKQISLLTDTALLEANPEELTDEAKAVYDAELEARGLSWPSSEAGPEIAAVPAGAFPNPEDGELVDIATFESFAEARFALTLLRQEDIPAWIKGGTTPGKISIDPNSPIDLVTHAEFLEAAQLLLNSEIDDEELARLAEEAGESAE